MDFGGDVGFEDQGDVGVAGVHVPGCSISYCIECLDAGRDLLGEFDDGVCGHWRVILLDQEYIPWR